MSLERTRADWERLGAADPLWAVLVDPARKNGRWDAESFFATGREEVDGVLAKLDALGVKAPRGTALDFGCGVGRLSQALADHYDEVIGVDISSTMLDHARAFDRSGGRCRFVLNTEPHLRQFADASVDLVYSSLVLQHVPRDSALAYLREFSRIVRPGGAVVVLLPTRIRLTFKGVLSLILPKPVVRAAQRRLLGYPASMDMTTFAPRRIVETLREGGVTVLATSNEEYSPHWTLTRFLAVK
jgi:SAM-dependent methyltransferase